MAVHILDSMARDGFEQVIALHDRDSKLRAFLGIHSTAAGPAFGGIRRWAYRDERQALQDCLRLARAMTQKCALADLPAGGGKLVLLDRSETDPRRAYRYIGEVVEGLRGRFHTGPDVGTGERELGWVSERTSYATDPGSAGPGQLAQSTAEGVFCGMGEALRHVDGEADWPARTVVIQGLGQAGSLLARRLREHGARVVGTDLDQARARSVAEELDIELVPPASEFSVPCDVFAPCGLGGVLHDVTLERLRCRVVAGSANNVLTGSHHGDRLHERGILYAPDIVVTSGALIRGVIFALEGRREPVEDIGARVADSLARVLARAADERDSPGRVAVREAAERAARPAASGRVTPALKSIPDRSIPEPQ